MTAPNADPTLSSLQELDLHEQLRTLRLQLIALQADVTVLRQVAAVLQPLTLTVEQRGIFWLLVGLLGAVLLRIY